MITDALAAHLRANLSLTSIYVTRANLDAAPCVVIDDNGDTDSRHWSGGAIVTGLKEQDYELSVWAADTEGGGKYANQIANEIVTLLDNFAGPLVDTTVSPHVTYRIRHIEATNGGGGFDAGPKKYGHSVFLTVTYR